jgi:hypothetical protein
MVRGLVCGAMTTLGGIGHTLPFLIPGFQAAFFVAFSVVLGELAVITEFGIGTWKLRRLRQRSRFCWVGLWCLPPASSSAARNPGS